MKVLFSCHEGLSDALELELKKYGVSVNRKGDSYCVVDVDIKQTGKLIYRIQTAIQVMEVIDEFEFKDFVNLLDKAVTIKLPGATKQHFRTTRIGTHEFKSPDVVESLRGELKFSEEKYESVTYLAYIEHNTCFMGIEFAHELSRRDYRIFAHNASVKGTVAASLVALASCKPKQIILDPFCKDGTVAIEAAFWTYGLTPRKHSWDRLAFFNIFKEDWQSLLKTWEDNTDAEIIAMDNSNHNLSAAKKNIQIAELKNQIRTLRDELEWISTRFEGINKIVSVVPSPTQRFPENKAKKLYSELFEAAGTKGVLNGELVFLLVNPELLISDAEKQGFSLKSDLTFKMGKQKAHVIILKK